MADMKLWRLIAWRLLSALGTLLLVSLAVFGVSLLAA